METDQEPYAGDTEEDARVQIQAMIDVLKSDGPNFTDPGNVSLDSKIDLLDKIYHEAGMADGEEVEDSPGDITVDVSHARLDIVAFSQLAVFHHQRTKRVAASSWTFRAADFANRIVKLMNIEGSQDESLTDEAKIKLDEAILVYFNRCVPLKPVLGAINLIEVEAVPKERRQRQLRTKEKVVAQQLQPRKLTDFSEDDHNNMVTKHVEYIMGCLQKEFRQKGKKPVSFYHFVIDPTSFSNSVENIFYVSFLIKDGFVSISEDGENGLPVLSVTSRRRETSSQASVSKKQLIISLDQDMWKEIVDGLHLTTAAIVPMGSNENNHVSRRQRQE